MENSFCATENGIQYCDIAIKLRNGKNNNNKLRGKNDRNNLSFVCTIKQWPKKYL